MTTAQILGLGKKFSQLCILKLDKNHQLVGVRGNFFDYLVKLFEPQ
jgi:hypothetical protein